MPTGLKRIYGRGDLHFITFSCYRRLHLLASERARNVFVQVLDRVRSEYGFKLVGYVVMPEHIHLLMTEPPRGTPSTVLKMLKQRVSHEMRKKRSALVRQELPGESSDRQLPQFWQHRFFDFNVWSRKKKIEKLAFMHANPSERGLVTEPKHWPWSSYAFYQRRGQVLIRIDPVD